MNLELIVRKRAEREIRNAFAWYEGQRPGLGAEFISAVGDSIAGIQANPFAFPVLHRDLRRALLRKFPYGIFFRIVNDRLILVACFHAHRDPNNWERRQ